MRRTKINRNRHLPVLNPKRKRKFKLRDLVTKLVFTPDADEDLSKFLRIQVQDADGSSGAVVVAARKSYKIKLPKK